MKTYSENVPEGSPEQPETLAKKLEQEIAMFAEEQKKHSLKFRTQLRDQLRTLTEHLSLVNQLSSIVSGITERELSQLMDPLNIDLNLLWGTDDLKLDKQLDQQLAKEILKLNEVASTLTDLFNKRDAASWGREQSMPHYESLVKEKERLLELRQRLEEDSMNLEQRNIDKLEGQIEEEEAKRVDLQRKIQDIQRSSDDKVRALGAVFRKMRVTVANDSSASILSTRPLSTSPLRKGALNTPSLPRSNENELSDDLPVELQRLSDEEYADDTKHRRDLIYAFDRRPTLSEAVLQILSDGNTYSTFDIATAGWEIEDKTSSEYKQLRPKLTKTIWREFKERKNIDQVKRGLYSSRYFESREDAIEDAFRRGVLVDLRPFNVNFNSTVTASSTSKTVGDNLSIAPSPRVLARLGWMPSPFSVSLRIAPHPDYSVRQSFWDWRSRDDKLSPKITREGSYPDAFTDEEIETELAQYIDNVGLHIYADFLKAPLRYSNFSISEQQYQECIETFTALLEERLSIDYGLVLVDSFIELIPTTFAATEDIAAEWSNAGLPEVVAHDWSNEAREAFCKRQDENVKNDSLAKALDHLRSRAKYSRNSRADTPPITPIASRIFGGWDPMFDYSLYDSYDPDLTRVLNESFAIDDAELPLLAVELGILDRVGSTYMFAKDKLASLESPYNERDEHSQVKKHGKAHPFDRSSEVHQFLLQYPAVRDEIHALIVMEVAKLQPPLHRLSSKPARWPKEGFRSRLNERARA